MVAAGLHTRDVAGPVLLERELSELAQAARDAVAGEGGLVLISGEAGIGKSSLVRTLRGLLPANGRLLVGHCDDLLEQVMSRYHEPLLRAAFHLQRRVYNIVEQAFLLRYLQRGSPAEQEYACRNTMFVLAEYLGWVEMLRRGVQFLDLGDVQRNQQLSERLEASAPSSRPTMGSGPRRFRCSAASSGRWVS
jgi:predicted ATPase